jgi:hypothetical protein
MTPEGKVKKDIKEYLHRLQAEGNLRVFMPEHMGLGESGVSDFIGVHVGRAFALEAKREELTGPKVEYATPWQWRFLVQWRAASGIAAVVRSVDDVRRVLSALHVNDEPIDALQAGRTE